jgi:2-iminobutanoate/2-iminopropanoate deaminase
MTNIRFENPSGSSVPVGQYTNVAVVAPNAGTVHVAGQLPTDESGAVDAPGDFAAQAELVFDRLAATLEGAGSSLAEAAIIRTYMVEEDHFALFRDARRAAFERHGVTSPPPATTIIAKALYGGSLIELDAVGVISSGQGA